MLDQGVTTQVVPETQPVLLDDLGVYRDAGGTWYLIGQLWLEGPRGRRRIVVTVNDLPFASEAMAQAALRAQKALVAGVYPHKEGTAWPL